MDGLLDNTRWDIELAVVSLPEIEEYLQNSVKIQKLTMRTRSDFVDI